MDKLVKLYCDLFCFHDKIHTYHIKTVNMPGCATLHGTLGGIYTGLEEIVDSFGENVVIKFLKKELPTPKECYKASDYSEIMSGNAEDIVEECYDEVEQIEEILRIQNNKADNCLAQLLSPIREKFTNFCADLAREMEKTEVDED